MSAGYFQIVRPSTANGSGSSQSPTEPLTLIDWTPRDYEDEEKP